MLTLNFKTAPYWIDLIDGTGIRFKVRPFSSTLLERAHDMADAMMAQGAAALAPASPDAAAGNDDTDQQETSRRVRRATLTIAVAKLVILEWEGVEDDDGTPVPVSPEAIEFAVDLPLINAAFTEKYVKPGFIMGLEKKGFAPLPSGNSAGAQNTAETASPFTETDAAPQGETPATAT